MVQLYQSGLQDTSPSLHPQQDQCELDSYNCVSLLSRSFKHTKNVICLTVRHLHKIHVNITIKVLTYLLDISYIGYNRFLA